MSRPHTFLVVPGPTVLGYLVTLDRSGNVSLPVSCIAPAGTVCTGTVSVLTQASYQPVPGGPVGQIRVLFAYVSVPAGKTVIVRGTLDSTTAQALRRLGAVKLQVSASFGAPIGDISVVRRLRPQ